MIARFRRWRVYRRALAALLGGALDGGYPVSAAAYRRYQDRARREAR